MNEWKYGNEIVNFLLNVNENCICMYYGLVN